MSVLNNISGAVLKPVLKEISRTRLPKIDGKLSISGLKEDVEIIRDELGIAHIYANNINDLMFAQGYVHAQDRLFQMELNRKVARGTLSEIIGIKALDSDRIARTMGYERVAKLDWELFDESEQQIIIDYCHGINAYITSADFKLPIEFTLLKFKPEKWHPMDVASFSRLLISLLTWGWYDEIIRAKLIEAVGAAAAAELDNTYPKENPITLPKGIEFNILDVSGKFQAMKGPYMPQISGSNAWTLSGTKTKTGKPFLCNDPHLTLKNPNIWYLNHLHCPDLHASGVTAPGLPMVQIGHNENIGWGITLSYTDIEDVFVEKFTDDTCTTYIHEGKLNDTTIIEEKIFVKGEKMPIIEKVYQTVHGTLISDVTGHSNMKLTLCSMAYQAGTSTKGWFLLNKAKNWNEFADAVKYITAPGLNIVYADKDNNIGYYNSGKVPVRDKASASVPQPGWTGEHDWKAFIPFDEMPHSLNPQNGYIVTANHKIEPDDFPHFLGDIYMNGYRANRLEKMIQRKEKLEPKDFTEMQMDFYCTPGKLFAAHYKNLQMENAELQQYVDMLLAWDGVLHPDKIEGSIYKVAKLMTVKKLYGSAIHDNKLIDELLGRGYHAIFGPVNSFLGHNTPTLLRILDDADSFWLKAAGGKEKLLREGFKNAIDWLKLNYGVKTHKWKWGNLHAIVFPHALSVQPPLDKVFDVGPYPIGGDTDTPFQTFIMAAEGYGGELAAPSYRQIIDFSDFDKSTVIMPLGNSGNMASPYYKNQLRDWFEGKDYPMCWTRKKVEEHQKHKLLLKKK
ncbi:MAG TPA: penicillin acylase family protein [Chitinophagales bacterium]|nr:penicillin acylase family protein [Chitinophagales bacterium]HNC72829.1 penicillin acylase family protein [Chitinophagales bacterium]HND83929.1 penicillin acylase family protein [Chitinophagales bacterium]HNF50952.1 penicillin acylase family protein [Chitinophagales bacterium]HNG71222.1 penicillin acylase family protein [Chitinophagales bacterium]